VNAQDHIELTKQGYAAFARGDIPAVLQLFAEDAELLQPLSTALFPWAGTRRGREQLAEFLAGLAEVGEFEQFEPREFIAQGDKVVVLISERFRIRATGRSFDNELVHVFTFKNGKASQLRIYEDTAPFLAAMGDRGAG
jgi:ketosteroid isomerase-like protein